MLNKFPMISYFFSIFSQNYVNTDEKNNFFSIKQNLIFHTEINVNDKKIQDIVVLDKLFDQKNME